MACGRWAHTIQADRKLWKEVLLVGFIGASRSDGDLKHRIDVCCCSMKCI